MVQYSEHQRNKGSNRAETSEQDKHRQWSPLKKSLRLRMGERTDSWGSCLLKDKQEVLTPSAGSSRAAGPGLTQCLQIQHLKRMNGHCALILEGGAGPHTHCTVWRHSQNNWPVPACPRAPVPSPRPCEATLWCSHPEKELALHH